MIDKEKWESADDEKKLEICNSFKDGANERALSKDDYNVMWLFLLNYINNGTR